MHITKLTEVILIPELNQLLVQETDYILGNQIPHKLQVVC